MRLGVNEEQALKLLLNTRGLEQGLSTGGHEQASAHGPASF